MKDAILKSLHNRYSVKTFDSSHKIKDEDWNLIEQALLLTPSSFGLEPWKFLVITNQELKAKLRTCSWGQTQIEDCSHLVVFCAKKQIDAKYIEHAIQNIAKVREVPLSSLDGYKKMIIEYANNLQNHLSYTSNQAFIALGNVLTVSAMLNIDSCAIGGFEPEKYNEILNISSEYTSCVVCAFGYRSEDDKYSKIKKVRQSEEDIIIKYT